MSRAGEGRAPAGFTLVELLVVLAILALALGIAVPFLGGGAGPRIDTLAREIAAELRAVRGEAIVSNREAVLFVDPAGPSLRRGNQGEPELLPRAVALAVTAARSETTAEGLAGIRFFPDGSSTGGTVALERDGRRIEVRVDWLSGRVRVVEAP
jgi:general secretion pathway protein H